MASDISTVDTDAPPTVVSGPTLSRRRLAKAILIALVFLEIVFNLYPVRNGSIRQALIALPSAIFAMGLWLFAPRRPALTILIATAAVLAAIAELPGRSVEGGTLARAYVKSLRRYEGATYIWGGETTLGIDCSGLVRSGLVDASLTEGWYGLDPGLIRQSVSLWWHDASAQELLRGYSGRTRIVIPDTTINSADHSLLQMGDFAVTRDGVHTLAYLGDRQWIEADPGEGRVIVVKTPSLNPWFKHRVSILRWRVLEGQ